MTLKELNQAMKEVKTPEQLHNEELNRCLEEEWAFKRMEYLGDLIDQAEHDGDYQKAERLVTELKELQEKFD